MITWASFLWNFYTHLKPPDDLPNGIEWLHPQLQPEVQALMQQFFDRFYTDTQSRTLLLGINPGRLGAGVTGINFTGFRQLAEHCGIAHSFRMQSELSAEFVYEVIARYGGAEAFYQNFFIGSVCPLGFVQGGKNLNYYDDKQLLQTVRPFIVENLHKLVSFRVNRKRCGCIGGEKNYRFLTALNKEHQWFEEIIPLPHPRFVQQYRRKQKEDYVQQYLHFLINS